MLWYLWDIVTGLDNWRVQGFQHKALDIVGSHVNQSDVTPKDPEDRFKKTKSYTDTFEGIKEMSEET